MYNLVVLLEVSCYLDKMLRHCLCLFGKVWRYCYEIGHLCKCRNWMGDSRINIILICMHAAPSPSKQIYTVLWKL